MITRIRGVWCLVFSVLGVICFSVFLLFSENLVFFWLFLELAGLSLIPGFFFVYGDVSFYTLFVYIVVSSLSSSFMLLGIIDARMIFFFVLGYLIKFGVFPFFGWVYSVVIGSNGLVVWLLSTFVKIPFVYICYFLCGLAGYLYGVVAVLCSISFILLSFLFWVYNYSWRCCWCHMMISSRCVVVVMSFGASLDLLVWLYLVYVIWSTLTIFFLFFCDRVGFCLVQGISGNLKFGLFFWFGYIFFLLTTPISFSFFYKVFASFCVFSCGWLVLVVWIFYGLSEQLFFFKYIISSFVSKVSLKWFYFVCQNSLMKTFALHARVERFLYCQLIMT